MNSWNSDSNLAAHMGQQRQAEVRVEHSAVPSTHPMTDEPPREPGSLRRWWSDHPMLSVAVMFVVPVVALLVFVAVV